MVLLADTLSVLASVPMDIISQRLQMQNMYEANKETAAQETAAGLRSEFRSRGARGGREEVVRARQCAERTALQMVRQIVRSEGLVGLWRGAGATIAAFGPNSAIWWLSHEHAKRSLAQRWEQPEGSAGVLSTSGMLAGISSTVATMPLDVVKTRLQCVETPTPLRTILRRLWSEAGWRAFYAGLLPRLLTAVPRSICTALAYERAIELCRK